MPHVACIMPATELPDPTFALQLYDRPKCPLPMLRDPTWSTHVISSTGACQVDLQCPPTPAAAATSRSAEQQSNDARLTALWCEHAARTRRHRALVRIACFLTSPVVSPSLPPTSHAVSVLRQCCGSPNNANALVRYCRRRLYYLAQRNDKLRQSAQRGQNGAG